jgi:hypothetical protein
MKKIQVLILGTLFLLAFESCSKDKLEPNNSKKTATKQQSTSDQPQTPPPAPHSSSCPHASTPQG